MTNKLTKNEILSVLNDWNFWNKDLNIGILRQGYLDILNRLAKTKQVLVIVGARRSGKSFVMRQFVKDLLKKGIPANQTLMINFEDPRLPKLHAQDLDLIYETYLEALNPKGKPYIFLDEIQEVDDWEKWVRTAHELDKAQIIISGSNAKLLSQELSTLLTGRHVDITVFPLSFKEYLSFFDLRVQGDLDFIDNKIEIKRLFSQYLEFGAFPEVVLSPEKREILSRYFDDIVNKDLAKRYNIRKTPALKSLAKFYFSNIANTITFRRVEKFLTLSILSIEKFSEYFTNAHLLFFVNRFSFKIKEQEKSPRKVYAIDSGLVNAVGFRFSENSGRLLENIVFLELTRRAQNNSNLEFYYWKDERHREVDFVIKDNKTIAQLIQVCKNLSDESTKRREIESLLKAMDELQVVNGIIITEDEEGEEKIENKDIKFIPVWKWLLM